MCESFGAQLRQRREEQQIALSTIAEQTKIKLSLLEALERGDVSRWPSGIFRRAFIRAYAHAIGLQPDLIVREFLEKFPDPLEEIAEAGVEAAADAASPTVGPPTRLRYLVGAAVGSLSRFRSATGQRRVADIGDPVATVNVPVDIPELRQPVVIAESELNDSAAAASSISTEMTEEPPAMLTTEAYQAPEDSPEEIPEEIIAPSEGSAPMPAPMLKPFEPDLSAAAQLCTELSRIDEPHEVAPLLGELARVVDAVGLIVWVWDAQAAELTPALPHGYSDEVLAQLPNLPREARNATAAAFRSAQLCSVSGGDVASDALVVPLMTAAGCAGVLAIELQPGGARRESVRALATIFAAQMARVVVATPPAAAANRRMA